ncbi:hypothetical protein GCM10022225_49930 [Plantactinospora mayteni]|uniref:Nucleotide exchange factor GrpE n=1 Tax=Plantactinospora mayteni TaxID=566021 RepID=A0ABQ4EXY1_9ACTN|nr:hypothetical protein [Plantactinospora mayteni]GIG99491.1 hypothetical protein Pma05_60640 [Plantactinospora mayteni]
MRRIARLREELRQRRHHREFRIRPPMWTEAQRARLEDLLTAVRDAGPAAQEMPQETPPETPQETPPETPPEAPDEAALATAVTNLWRAQRKLATAGDRPSPRDRQASRYLRTSTEALADAGLVVQDHDGDDFNAGRELEVLVYQENPALTAETVIETVRPSVYLHGRLVQMGQVIVGTPIQPVDGGNEHA